MTPCCCRCSRSLPDCYLLFPRETLPQYPNNAHVGFFPNLLYCDSSSVTFICIFLMRILHSFFVGVYLQKYVCLEQGCVCVYIQKYVCLEQG